MKKIKDIFYDVNDILVALVIVALAAFVIVNNIDSILAYPSSIAEEIQIPEEDIPTHYAENPPAEEQGAGEDTAAQEDSETAEIENYSISIEYGATGEKIADLLINVGLMETRKEFYNAVAAAGAEGKLQAGNFMIPSNATPAEVISIITN